MIVLSGGSYLFLNGVGFMDCEWILFLVFGYVGIVWVYWGGVWFVKIGID